MARQQRFTVHLHFGVLACMSVGSLLPGMASAAWRERPNARALVRFANRADSVVVRSVVLADSAEAGKRWGVGLLDVAHVRQSVVQPAAWSREFLALLLTRDNLEADCRCDLVRSPQDTIGLARPIAELHIQDETMWIVLSLRDSCASIFLPQGPWGVTGLGKNWSRLLQMLHAALPAESGFDADSFPSRPIDFSTDYVYVERLPEQIDRIAPEYPAAAREKAVSGTVLIQALIDKEGRVEETRVVWSLPYLNDSAVEAVKQWRFRPALSGGKPVKVWVNAPVKFTLH